MHQVSNLQHIESALINPPPFFFFLFYLFNPTTKIINVQWHWLGVQQLLVGRRKAGVLPGSIPIEILKEIANWFHSKVTTQSIRELLLKKDNFPKSISLDAQFFRNLRLYLEYHKIRPDMPVQEIQKALEIDPNKTGIEYEDIILCAQKASSATAAAAREAFSEHIEDVLVFLAFIEAKDPSFAKKVQNIYVQLYLSSLEFC